MASGFNEAPSQHKSLFAPSVSSATALTQQMQSYFSEIKDPRVQRTRAHLLVDILIIGILSVIAGGRGWEDMETYGLSKHDWLKQFLALPNGIPSPDTFRRVFERIDPKVFERCFRSLGTVDSRNGRGTSNSH